jgi:3-hydroxyacyl-CoA dehydrogenase
VPTEVPPNDPRHLITTGLPVTIALIGATPIAEQIAARALRAGLNVIIDDVSDYRLQAISLDLRAVVRAQDSCAPGPQNQSTSPQSDLSSPSIAASPLSSLSPTLTLTQSIEPAIRAADFLIDTLLDDLEVKLELFTLFDKFAKPNAIFITTGSILIDDLAEITFCPDRCAALRLTVAPDNAEPIYQLIPGKQTSPQTLAICTQLLGKLLSS